MVTKKPLILFNASVVLAGFKSPQGGSGKVLWWAREGKVKGVISEIILDEILRNGLKIGFDKEYLHKKIISILQIKKEPTIETVNKFQKIVLNLGDAHVLASSLEIGVDYLVTLDQKHLLILKDKIKQFKIVTPGQLIEIIDPKSKKL